MKKPWKKLPKYILKLKASFLKYPKQKRLIFLSVLNIPKINKIKYNPIKLNLKKKCTEKEINKC